MKKDCIEFDFKKKRLYFMKHNTNKMKNKEKFKWHRVLSITKEGYDNYSWFWWIISLSALIGNSLFGAAGLSTVIFSFVIFYILGALHKKISKPEDTHG